MVGNTNCVTLVDVIQKPVTFDSWNSVVVRYLVGGELINILHFYWVGNDLILDYLTSYF